MAEKPGNGLVREIPGRKRKPGNGVAPKTSPGPSSAASTGTAAWNANSASRSARRRSGNGNRKTAKGGTPPSMRSGSTFPVLSASLAERPAGRLLHRRHDLPRRRVDLLVGHACARSAASSPRSPPISCPGPSASPSKTSNTETRVDQRAIGARGGLEDALRRHATVDHESEVAADRLQIGQRQRRLGLGRLRLGQRDRVEDHLEPGERALRVDPLPAPWDGTRRTCRSPSSGQGGWSPERPGWNHAGASAVTCTFAGSTARARRAWRARRPWRRTPRPAPALPDQWRPLPFDAAPCRAACPAAAVT